MEQMVLDVMREGIVVTLKVSMPMLLAALVIGLIISIFQAATSIQEQTLTFVPKILGIFMTMIVLGSWMITTLVAFINKVFTSFSIFLN